MGETTTRRLLVSDEQVVVVLDTAPARELAYADEPPAWVDTFSQMSRDGYSFSLADGAFAELLNRRANGGITGDQLQRIIERLSRFLSPNLPILPGKRDLRGMLQLKGQAWDEEECQALSQGGWDELRRCVDTEDLPRSLEEMLQQERDEWINNIIQWRKKITPLLGQDNLDGGSDGEAKRHRSDLNSKTEVVLGAMEKIQDVEDLIIPPMSVRNHLQNRYICRQIMRSLKHESPYNPESRGNRNDGIDADLYRFLILPAFVVTRDNGFLGGLASIDSFQTGWFFTPEDLAAKWVTGARPVPTWPDHL